MNNLSHDGSSDHLSYIRDPISHIREPRAENRDEECQSAFIGEDADSGRQARAHVFHPRGGIGDIQIIQNADQRIPTGYADQKVYADSEPKESPARIRKNTHPTRTWSVNDRYYAFQEFWDVWPRSKKTEQRKRALHVWMSLPMDDTLFNAIIVGVKGLQGEYQRYEWSIPLAANWLLHKRWLDEYRPAKQEARSSSF